MATVNRVQLNGSHLQKRRTPSVCIASYPGRVGGEKRPGIDRLRMRNRSLGIHLLRLEIVGKIIDYTMSIAK